MHAYMQEKKISRNKIFQLEKACLLSFLMRMRSKEVSCHSQLVNGLVRVQLIQTSHLNSQLIKDSTNLTVMYVQLRLCLICF